MSSGVYEIEGPVLIGSNTVLTGEKDTIIRVSPSSSQWFTGSIGIINAREQPLNNVEIYGFQIDGNLDKLPRSYANEGNGDHNAERLILLRGSTNAFMNGISIHDMQLYDSYSDGIHIAFANNVNCYNNFVSNCQHSGIYYVSVVDGLIKDNEVAGITGDCVRLDNCVNNILSGNTLYSYMGDNSNGAYQKGQNSIQIADQGYSHGGGSDKPTHTANIEVSDNTFANTGLRSIWIDSTGKGVENVYIYHNKFVDVAEVTIHGEPVSNDNPPSKEMSEEIFDSIFDILNLSFVDSGNSTSQNVYPEINWQEKGKSLAWVDIVGWNNLTERNDVFYIPEGEQPIVRYEAKGTAARPISTDTSLTLTEANKTLTADLKVKAVYEVGKRTTKTVLGLSIPSVELVRKSQTSHYFDSETMPETYKPLINTTAYVTIVNYTLSP